MKVAPSGFCLEPLHAKHPSRKQDNSLEKNDDGGAKCSRHKPSSNSARVIMLVVPNHFFRKVWSWDEPEWIPHHFSILRDAVDVWCFSGQLCTFATRCWIWMLGIKSVNLASRSTCHSSSSSALAGAFQGRLSGHVSNTKSVPKNSQWMGWRQNLKETMFVTYVFNVLYQQWHGFPVGSSLQPIQWNRGDWDTTPSFYGMNNLVQTRKRVEPPFNLTSCSSFRLPLIFCTPLWWFINHSLVGLQILQIYQ